MMYKILIRFVLIKNNQVIEAYLDNRIGFNDNFKLLKNVLGINIENAKVFDPIRKIFLDRNIPLNNFEFETFKMFYLFI